MTRRSRLEMTHVGVMKQLRLRERAGLVVSRKVGRRRLHHRNRAPMTAYIERPTVEEGAIDW